MGSQIRASEDRQLVDCPVVARGIKQADVARVSERAEDVAESAGVPGLRVESAIRPVDAIDGCMDMDWISWGGPGEVDDEAAKSSLQKISRDDRVPSW